LPFRSHNLIFNDWFRDENLQPSLAVPVNDGPDSQSDYNIERSRNLNNQQLNQKHLDDPYRFQNETHDQRDN
jgi:hypothetical protein